jgi:uncharacterized membrane protein
MTAPPAHDAASAATGTAGVPEPRRLGARYGASWWAEGWRVFAAAPGAWIVITIVFVLVMIALLYVPIIGPIAQTVLLPVFAGGVMLGCNALALGQPLRVAHLFDGFRSSRLGSLVILGLVMLAAGIVLGLIVVTVIFMTVGVAGLGTLSTLTDPAAIDLDALWALGIASLLIVFAVAFVGVALIAMAYWFAPALVAIHGEEPVTALRKSFTACVRNLDAMVIYGLIHLVLSIVATITFGLGWLVVGPMVIGSCYAGWRTIFA